MLRFEGVTFGYARRRPVLEEFSFDLPAGKTVLLGPNGAGKSTVLGLAASLLRPWRGSVTANGRTGNADRRSIGWMPQRVRAVPGLRCREQVAYYGWLMGMNRVDAWTQAARRLDDVALLSRAQDRAKDLSGGQLRRLGLAQTLIADPSILLLDEPTAGLDPAQRHRFGGLIASLVDVDVLVSTHETSELSVTYDHVAVIDAGQLRFLGSAEDFVALAPLELLGLAQIEAAYSSLVAGEG